MKNTTSCAGRERSRVPGQLDGRRGISSRRVLAGGPHPVIQRVDPTDSTDPTDATETR